MPIFSIHSINDVSLNYNQDPIVIRSKNPENSVRFLATLEETNWSSLEGYDDPNNAYNSFLTKYSETYNACFPLKKLAGKRKRINKPWLSKALIKCIKRKNKLYKLYIQNPSTDREIIYKHYKNKLNHSLRIAKRLYYERKLDKVKSKTRDTWRLLNEILNRKKKKVKTSPIFKADDREFSDPVEIANKFCTYFTNIGPSLAKNIQSLHSHRCFLTGSFTQSIYLNPTTKEEIIEIAKTFISGKAAGYDQIPMSIIKQSIHLISEPLTHIINLSIYHGIVPDEMKIARVIPVFKSDDQSLFTNYRPVSVLPSFSKFLERIIYNRLVHYLQSFNILCDNQYGFRKDHSTSLAIIDLYDKISTAFDQGEFAIGLFLDLSKAFDTVDHAILFDKLEYYGIRGLALDWIKNYFSNRTQYVEFNGKSSVRSKISCGVPQGSILGPLFFLIYINDINNVSAALNLILFADDTSVFMSHKDLDYLAHTLNLELNKLSIWFKANKLSLNLKKTKYIVFRPSQRRINCNIVISIDDQHIDRAKETVFLGVILDENLNWKSQISHIATKVSKSIGIIYKCSFYLSKTPLRILYYSLIYPYFHYCNVVWASTYKTNLRRLVTLQKRAVRIINNSNFDAHTDPIFKELSILKFNDIHLLQLGQFMYSYKSSSLPLKFSDKFLQNSQFHNYNTRNSHALHLPYCRTNVKKFSVFFQGPKFYNSLDSEIINTNSIYSFKKTLKNKILNNYE